MKVYKLLGPNNSGLEDHAAIQGQSGSAAPSRSLEL
jgi:hypothetical protein